MVPLDTRQTLLDHIIKGPTKSKTQRKREERTKTKQRTGEFLKSKRLTMYFPTNECLSFSVSFLHEPVVQLRDDYNVEDFTPSSGIQG